MIQFRYLRADFSRLLLWMCSNVILNVLLVSVICSFGAVNSLIGLLY